MTETPPPDPEPCPGRRASALTEQFLDCPYCGERISVLVDHSVALQRYVEDCEVCCRPLDVTCRIERDATARVSARRMDD